MKMFKLTNDEKLLKKKRKFLQLERRDHLYYHTFFILQILLKNQNQKTNNKPLILPPVTINLIKERIKVRRLYIKTRNPFLKSEITKLKKQIDESIASFKRN